MGIDLQAARPYRKNASRLLGWTAVGMYIIHLLAGCTLFDADTTHHIGYVRIVEAEGSTQGVTAKAIRTTGIRVSRGVGLGYFDEERIVVPIDCRLVIILETQAELAEALQRLESLERNELCIASVP